MSNISYQDAFVALPADKREVLLSMDWDEAIEEDSCRIEQQEYLLLQEKVRAIAELLLETPFERTTQEIEEFLSLSMQ